jgi:hypothetical protein
LCVQGTTLKRFFCIDDGVNVEFDIHAIVLLCTTRSFTPSPLPPSPVTSHSVEREKGMYWYSHLATKRNKKQENSIYMTYVKICTTLTVEHLPTEFLLWFWCVLFSYISTNR